MFETLLRDLRPLLHPIVVHFPIALLFVSVGVDWLGFWLRNLNLTRAGFYTLVLGTAGAGVAALTGPDHASGGADVVALLTQHQTFALITVAIAAALMWVRFLTADGIRDGWAMLYLACTLVLVAAVSLTGYFGGELTYHQGIGVTVTSAGAIPGGVEGVDNHLIPVKPLVALIGLLSLVGLGLWLGAGSKLAGAYFAAWSRGVRGEYVNMPSPIWTLRCRLDTPEPHGPRARSEYAGAPQIE